MRMAIETSHTWSGGLVVGLHGKNALITVAEFGVTMRGVMNLRRNVG
jgi:hypothetical protein